MIKALVFDMGGVLVKLDWEGCVRKFKEEAGFDSIMLYLDRYHQKGFISEMEEGLISEEDFVDECLKYCRPGTERITVKRCFAAILDKMDPRAVELLKSCYGKIDMYVLSNNNPITYQTFRDFLEEAGVPMDTTFKKAFFSFQMHLLKPGIEIYNKVIEEIGVKPEEVLFVDDSKSNIEGAEAAGFHTLLFNPGGDLKEEVERELDILNKQ